MQDIRVEMQDKKKGVVRRDNNFEAKKLSRAFLIVEEKYLQ
jgi:hypothetical protein